MRYMNFFIIIVVMIAGNLFAENTSVFSLNLDEIENTQSVNPLTYDVSRDELENTYSFFNELDGMFPSEICYVNEHNKYFVYGHRIIKVFDANLNVQIDEIDISSYGHIEISNGISIGNIFRDLRMVYNNDRILCITEGFELLMIDVLSHQILDTQIRPNCLGDSEKIANMRIEINPLDERLYLIINNCDSQGLGFGDDAGGRLVVYDINTNDLTLVEELEFFGNDMSEFIRDIAFHPTSNYFYLTFDHEIVEFDGITFLANPICQTNHFAGLLNVVNDGEDYILVCAPGREPNNPLTPELTVINLSNYSINTISLNYSKLYTSEIDTDNNRIYYSVIDEQQDYSAIVSYNYVEDSLNESFFILPYCERIFDLFFDSSLDYLCYATQSGLGIVNVDGEPPSLISDFRDLNKRMEIILIDNQIITINTNNCSVDIFDLNCLLLSSTKIGEEAYKTIVSGRADRVFMFKTYGNHLVIFNISTQNVEFFTLPYEIVDVTVDDLNFRLFVIFNNGQIICYNSTTMSQLLTMSLTSQGTVNFQKDIHYHNGFLYACNDIGLDIFGLDLPGGWSSNHVYYDECSAFDFITDYQNDRVIAIGTIGLQGYGYNNILILSEFNVFINYDNIPNNRCEFVYNQTNGKIYFLGFDDFGEYVYSMDPETGTFSPIYQITEENNNLLYLQVSSSLNELYVNWISTSPDVFSKIIIFDLEDETVKEIIEVPFLCSQMFFNEFNRKLYVLNLHEWANDFQMNMFSIEVENNYLLTHIPLNFNERLRADTGGINFRGFLGCTSIVPYMDRLFVARGNNVLQEILCTKDETKILSKGWNWESFPRLEREETINEPTDIVTVLEEIDPFNIVSLEMETNDLDNEPELTYQEPNWYPYQYEVRSSWLCKIMMEPDEERTLSIPGTTLPEDFILNQNYPDERFPLEADEYHWIGYWLQEPRNIQDALAYYWDDVEKVKGEDWYYDVCYNNRSRGESYGVTWSPEGKTMEYGKGYMIYFKEGTEPLDTFQWNLFGEIEEPIEKSESENFTYTELSDYEAIDIIDIPENVVEIGVFQDNMCVGAVVVQDSEEQILVYSDNTLREPMPYNFEIVTNNREAILPVEEYFVLNRISGEFETGIVISGQQDVSVIRLGKFGDPQSEPPVIYELKLNNNFPNPFNPKTNISFSIPTDQEIELNIYNLKGQKVKELINGQFVSGSHSIIWDGKDDSGKQVGSGLYFYKLNTSDKEISKKMLLLK